MSIRTPEQVVRTTFTRIHSAPMVAPVVTRFTTNEAGAVIVGPHTVVARVNAR